MPSFPKQLEAITLIMKLKTQIITAALAISSTVCAETIADFSADVSTQKWEDGSGALQLNYGFGTGWFNYGNGTFNGKVAGGFDLGDRTWTMGQVSGSNTTSFMPTAFTTDTFENTAGTWKSTANNLLFSRAASAVEATTAQSHLTVFAVAIDKLDSPVDAYAVAEFGEAQGEINYQVFVNNIPQGSPVTIGTEATQNESPSFTVSQGDTLYFVIDSAGSAGGDRRTYNFKVASTL